MEVLATRLSWRRLSWSVELFSIGVGYAVYSMIRIMAPHRVLVSYDHAYQVAGLEQAVGIYHELGINAFLSKHTDLGIVSAYYYASLHFIVTPLLLVWLWKRRTWAYAPLRSALVIATALALVVYATWPLAPPRFALPGTVDTVFAHPVVWASGGGEVTVKANGRMEILSVRIDPKLLAEPDVELLEDLVTSATNQALTKAREAAAKSMASIAGGLPIPGLSNMFGALGGGS